MELKEIEKRLSEIKEEIRKDGANLEALEAETDALIEKRNVILEKNAERRRILDKVSEGEFGEGEPVLKDEERTISYESVEYRSGWLKSIRNLELSALEKRAVTTIANTSVGSVVPKVTANKIIEKVKTFAPLLEKIDLLHVPGGIVVPAEGTTIEAATHAEGAKITADDDKMLSVSLLGYEVTKLITISKSVEKMSIDAFEAWLVKKIAKAVAEKITKLILLGTGSNEAQGINSITWNSSNSVNVAKSASLTEGNVLAVVGMLNAGYDSGAEWIMSKSTFMSDFYPLMNASKNNIVTFSDSKYYVAGYEVTYDDRMTAHEAILGNLERGYQGNMPEDINVTSQFVARENAYDFLGSAIFDGKVSAIEAFVKIAKGV